MGRLFLISINIFAGSKVVQEISYEELCVAVRTIKSAISKLSADVSGTSFNLSVSGLHPPLTVAPPPLTVVPPPLTVAPPPLTVAPPPLTVKSSPLSVASPQLTATLSALPVITTATLPTVTPPPLTTTPLPLTVMATARLATVEPPPLTATPSLLTVAPPPLTVTPPPLTVTPPPLIATPSPLTVVGTAPLPTVALRPLVAIISLPATPPTLTVLPVLPLTVTSLPSVATTFSFPLIQPLTSTSPSPAEATSPLAATPAPLTATPAPLRATPAPQAATPAPLAATPAPLTATPAPLTATPAPLTATPAPLTATPAPLRVTFPLCTVIPPVHVTVALAVMQGLPAIAAVLALFDLGSYVFLDTNKSPEENRNVLNCVRPQFIITDELEKLAPLGVKSFKQSYRETLSIFSEELYIFKFSETNFNPFPTSQDLAFVITTSGTTGVPKIVFVPQNCIMPNVMDFCNYFKVRSQDIFFSAAPLTFDPSIVNLLVSIMNGAQIVMASGDALLSGTLITEVLLEKRVTILQATPSLLSLWNTAAPLNSGVFSATSALRLLAVGGEPLPPLAIITSWLQCLPHVQLFNLYGITEVSSWATLKHVHWKSNADDSQIDLGNKLQATNVFVVDNGKIVHEGEGEIYIGRHCNCVVINSLDVNSSFTDDNYNVLKKKPNVVTIEGFQLYPSGDVGQIHNDKIYFKRRNELNIKVLGKKFDLSSIEIACYKIRCVKACYVTYLNKQIIAFIVLINSDNTISDKKLLQLHIGLKFSTRICLLNNIPINTHGKIDKIKLLQILNIAAVDCNSEFNASPGLLYDENIRDIVRNAWLEYLPCEPSPECNFVASGGDSVLAVMLLEHLQQQLRCTVTLALDALLNGNFRQFISAVQNCLNNEYNGNNKLTNDWKQQGTVRFSSFEDLNNRKKIKLNDVHLADVVLSRWGYLVDGHLSVPVEEHVPCATLLSWSHNLGKCIDASPLLVCTRGQCLVFVGSHSGRLCCLDAITGAVRWERLLQGRIEASVSVSSCGTVVYVACYAGYLYCLAVADGTILWNYKADAEIKSSPIVDQFTGNVYFGSHDKNVYGLDQDGNLLWKKCHSGASIFSSVCVYKNFVFVACLKGVIRSYHKLTGDVLWQYSVSHPIFASLVSFSGGVITASVDHCVYAVSSEGELLWRLPLTDQCYCTPRVLLLQRQEVVVVADNAGALFILSNTGEVLHMHQLHGKIYATPFLYTVSSQGSDDFMCVAVTSSGTVSFLRYCLRTNPSRSKFDSRLNCVSLTHSKNKENYEFIYVASVMHIITCCGEVFSSPIIYDGRLYMCGRDDNISCYLIQQSELK